MDTTQITHISLCSGYGGIDLGLKRVLPNLRTVAYAEIEAFACENLLARMEGGQLDAAPVWSDLKSFPWERFSGLVDILSGGYPCQPFSSAGKRAGADDSRHLWPYIADGIRILQPRVCFFENVEGHITLGLSSVISDLEELGYTVSWGIFSAAECGAPHQRKRVFILAHSNSERGQLSHWGRLTAEQVPVGNGAAWRDVWPSRPGQPQHAWEPPRVVGNARGNGRRQDQQGRESKGRVAADGAGESMGNATESRLSFSGGQSGPLGQPRTQSEPERSDESLGNAEDRDSRRNALQLRQGQEQHRGTGGSECDGRRQTQPSLGRDTDGSASGLDYAELCTACDNRTDELRLLGNGVVPATAELAFRTLINEIQIAAAS